MNDQRPIVPETTEPAPEPAPAAQPAGNEDAGVAGPETPVAAPAPAEQPSADRAADSAAPVPLPADQTAEPAQAEATRPQWEAAPADDAASEAESAREALRERLMAQFERWLDRTLSDEPPPQGVPAELLAELEAQGISDDRECDLYALFSAMTVLSGEVRLQGRAFKQVADALAPVGSVPQQVAELAAAQREAAEQLGRLSEQLREAEAAESAMPSSKDMLEVLMDLYDRLRRGLHTFDASMKGVHASEGRGWLRRWLGGGNDAQRILASAEGMRQGYEMTLSRLEAALHQWEIEHIGEAGDAFDPQVMSVIEVQETDKADDGRVLEVYRSGYALHGQVLATAQVKVGRARRQ